MFGTKKEKESFLIFIFCCLPLTIELVHNVGMLTIIDWHIICLAYIYWQLCYHRRKGISQIIGDGILNELCHIALTTLVTHAWISFLSSIRSVIVACLLEDITTSNHNYSHLLSQSCKTGVTPSCLNVLNQINKHSTSNRICPSSIVGSRLGYVYFFFVIIFRFIPCAIYGLWILYSWNNTDNKRNDGLKCTDDEMHEKHISSSFKQLKFNQTYLFVCVGIICSCVVIEIALQGNVHSLSSPNVIMPYIALVYIQYCFISKRYRESTLQILIILQKLAMQMSIIYSLLDFFIQVMYVTSVCIPDVISVSEITDICSRAVHESKQEEKCHELIQKHIVKPMSSDMCPSFFNEKQSIISVLYTANVIKVFVLSLGTLLLKPSIKCEENRIKRR
jgi:hypothetical protein